MCETCGCGESGEFKIHDLHHNHDHGQDPLHSQEILPGHMHGHDSMLLSQPIIQPLNRVLHLNMDILSDNNSLARLNRRFFEERKVLCLNMVSSPGSGKTSILEKTIRELIPTRKISVIEGDQQTLLDAERIEKSGAPAIQINTGSGCHLDARMVSSALKKLEVESGSILFIENVGNLVCPALFDLGEFKRVVVISVTEGDDKPLKYPYMFQSSHLCMINKSDLLPYVDFDTEKTINYARSVNPDLEFILVSAKTGQGMDLWYAWLAKQAQ
jgi:hydrogenase nickel incorporation protein HypB